MATKKTDYQSAEEQNIQAAARSKSRKLLDMLSNTVTYPDGGAGRGYVNPARSDMVSGEMPKPNSREQYNAEKEAGGAMTDLSYAEWKKL